MRGNSGSERGEGGEGGEEKRVRGEEMEPINGGGQRKGGWEHFPSHDFWRANLFNVYAFCRMNPRYLVEGIHGKESAAESRMNAWHSVYDSAFSGRMCC